MLENNKWQDTNIIQNVSVQLQISIQQSSSWKAVGLIARIWACGVLISKSSVNISLQSQSDNVSVGGFCGHLGGGTAVI